MRHPVNFPSKELRKLVELEGKRDFFLKTSHNIKTDKKLQRVDNMLNKMWKEYSKHEQIN